MDIGIYIFVYKCRRYIYVPDIKKSGPRFRTFAREKWNLKITWLTEVGFQRNFIILDVRLIMSYKIFLIYILYHGFRSISYIVNNIRVVCKLIYLLLIY